MSEHDDISQEEMDDAIIKDTVHCDLCGASWILGGNADGICVNLPQLSVANFSSFVGKVGGQLSLCMDCAAMVARTYEAEIKDGDICEHGVLCGDWCAPCNAEYRRAREADGD